MRWIIFFALGIALLYLFYDNFDNPTLRAAEATMERLAPDSNSVIVLDKLGLPNTVYSKLAKRTAGPTIVLVEDKDFNQAQIVQIAAQYGRPVVGLRLQVAMASNYANVTYSRIDNGILYAPQVIRVNYDSRTDLWRVA